MLGHDVYTFLYIWVFMQENKKMWILLFLDILFIYSRNANTSA
jgi:hypothetical protein